MLVAQDRVHVERFTRDGTNCVLTEFASLDDVLELTSLEVTIPLSEIYRKVFPAE